MRNDIALRAPDLHQILLAGARAAGVDAYALYNQPQDWGGRAHPLSQLAGWPSPSFLHSARLPSSSEQFMARLSGDARKRMRWRMRKLEQCGRVSFLHASKPEEIHSIITAFREQKKLRLRELGAAADLDVDLMAAFIADAALAGEPGVELHALLAGNRVAAMYCGLVHDGRYHAMANCYDATPDVSRTSPGELIMIFLLESLCKRGVREFDLGVGEAAYKDKWCERREPLFDTFHGVTPKGKVYALALGMKQRTKRRIKQSETLWPLAKKLRAAIRWRA
ncbi:MAG: GNAT family N-acetyltransferase [Beijerinckiaceae bacterium]